MHYNPCGMQQKSCIKPSVTDCWVINRWGTDIAGVTCSCRAALQINDIYEVSCCSWLAGCPKTVSAQRAAAEASLQTLAAGTSSQGNLVKHVQAELKVDRWEKMFFFKVPDFQWVLHAKHSLDAMLKLVLFNWFGQQLFFLAGFFFFFATITDTGLTISTVTFPSL